MFKTKAIAPCDIDLQTGSREFDHLENDDEELRYKSLTLKEKIVYQIKNW